MRTVDMKCSSIEERRKLLDSAGSAFFSCEFLKKCGSVRKMTCKKFINAYLHGKPGENVNTVAHIDKYFTVAEMNAKSFKNVNLENLISAKINNVEYKFV